MHPFKLLVAVSTSILLTISPTSALAQGKKTNKSQTGQVSKICNDKLKDWEIKQANIGPHQIKYDILGNKANISKFELCKCKDKSIVIREKIAKVV
ncbi:MAG: hypothetical protein Q3971_04620 [Moraxella sp.]|nr:hypothetical protein [Moraxella sp.]